MKSILVIFFSFISILTIQFDAHSQRYWMYESYNDSLTASTNRIDSIKYLCNKVWCAPHTYRDSIIKDAKLALQLALSTSDSILIADSWDALARAYWWNNDIEKAEKFYKKSLQIAFNNNYLYKVAHVYQNLAHIANSKDSLEAFKAYMKKSIAYFENQNLDLQACKCYMGLISEANQVQYVDTLIYRYRKYLEQNTYDYATMIIYLDLAHLYTLKADRTEAIKSLQQVVEIADSTNSKWATIDAYMQIADYFKNYQQNYPVALKYYKKVMEIKHSSKLNMAHSIYNKIGEIHELQGNDSLAMVFFNKQLNYGINLKFKLYYAPAYLKLGDLEFKNQNYVAAIDYYKKAVQLVKNYINSIKYHDVLIHIGDAYFHLHNTDSARIYYKKSLELAKSANDNRSLSQSYSAFGKFYSQQADIHKAIRFHHKAYENALKSELLNLQQESTKILSQLYKSQKNFEQAYNFIEISNQLLDSIKKQNDAKNLAQLETYFEYKKMQEQKEKDKQLANSEINQQIQTRNVFIAGFVMTLLLGAITYLAYKRKHRDNALLKKQKAEIEHMSIKIHEQDQVKLRFFTNISHELRTPLTLILGMSEKLRNSVNNNPYVSLIRKNAKIMHQLIDNLLDLHRLDEAKMKLIVNKGNLTNFIQGIIAHFEMYAYEKGIALLMENTSKQDITVFFDHEKTEKIISNLVLNALKFTNKGGKILINITYSNSGHAIIKVFDTGVGMTKEEIEQIFNRFYTSTKNAKQGSGIGLAVVKELVELHKGKITVESSENKGTSFTIKLPVEEHFYNKTEISGSIPEYSLQTIDEELNASNILAQQNNDMCQDDVPFADRRLMLIVEDNDDLRAYIASIFNSRFHIIEASDGKQGIEAAREYVPDIIISDIMMPTVDGIELVNEIKCSEPTSHIPVILLTAKTDSASKLKGYNKGADDYISKPFESEILKSRVENLLQLRKQLIEKFTKQYHLQPREVIIEDADKKFLQKTIDVIENNIADEHLNVDFLASELHVSRTQLYRKLKALTGYSANQFVRVIRIKRAAQLLEQRQNNISEIMDAIGFSNYSYFKNCFKEIIGKSPKEYSLNSEKAN